MTWNSTLYNCKGKPEIVTKALSAASSGPSSKATTSLHFSYSNTITTTIKDALFDRKIDITTEGLELQYVNHLRTLRP
jgi:hypothetical protein